MLTFAEPLDEQSRRAIARKTRRLIDRRNELDEALILEASKKRFEASSYVRRADLILQHQKLQRRELRYVKRQSQALAECEKTLPSQPDRGEKETSI